MKKKRFNPASFAIMSLLHVGAILGLTRAGSASAKVWILAGVLWVLTNLGVTVGYHRMETHGGFKTFTPVKWILFALGAMTLQGEVRGWVLTHRAHHKYQDQPGLDPHSPREYKGLKGLAWAHMGWMFFHYKPPVEVSSAKLDQDPAVRWHSRNRNYLIMVGASFLVPFLIAGWNGLLVAGLLRIVVGLHITWSVNSVCHWWGTRAKDSEGVRNPDVDDDSRNNLLMAILAFGEGWHANHHVRPACAYHGWRWWEVDMSKWVIRSLEAVHLAWNVKKPHQFYFGRQLQAV